MRERKLTNHPDQTGERHDLELSKQYFRVSLDLIIIAGLHLATPFIHAGQRSVPAPAMR